MIGFVFIKSTLAAAIKNCLDVSPNECGETSWRLILSPRKDDGNLVWVGGYSVKWINLKDIYIRSSDFIHIIAESM